MLTQRYGSCGRLCSWVSRPGKRSSGWSMPAQTSHIWATRGSSGSPLHRLRSWGRSRSSGPSGRLCGVVAADLAPSCISGACGSSSGFPSAPIIWNHPRQPTVRDVVDGERWRAVLRSPTISPGASPYVSRRCLGPSLTPIWKGGVSPSCITYSEPHHRLFRQRA